MPPMLYVPLDELACSSPQQMRSRDIGSAIDERGDVLQLVAEAVRTSRLIEGGPRPDATAERLIDEPSVDERVQSVVGRVDADRVEESVPLRRPLGECPPDL